MTTHQVDRPLWIVAADAAVAKFFSSASPRAPTTFVSRIDHAAGRAHAKDLVSSRPGSSQGDASGQPHAYQPKHDPHEVEELLFAREIASHIEHARVNGIFGQLALAMPPKLLGLVRHGLSPMTRAAVVTELHQRIVDETADEIGERVHAASQEARLR